MAYADTWASTDINRRDSEGAPPPGKYTVQLIAAETFTSRAGKDWLKLTWEVTGGDHHGHSWDDLRGFEGRATASSKTTCAIMGIDVDALPGHDMATELGPAVEPLVGNLYPIEIKQNGEYRNVFVLGDRIGTVEPVSGIPADAADLATPAEAGGDDIPF